MDGNKDEALRCIGIAKEAIASGNKQRALKFIRIARRLDRNLSVDDLFAACENLDSAFPGPPNDEKPVDGAESELASSAKVDEVSNGERNYTEEQARLIGKIRRSKDYYDILGLEKSCSVEEIRKAYRKLSLRVHPDKNKAPGSEDAFKKVSKAFKCLSNDDSRRQYDHTGLVEEFECDQQYNVGRRRTTTGRDLFDDDFDPDEIFRSFCGQTNTFGAHACGARGMGNQQREDFDGAGPNPMFLLQLLPFLIIFLLAYIHFSEPNYSLQKNYSYQFPKFPEFPEFPKFPEFPEFPKFPETTEKLGVEFYVKSPEFDQTLPPGSQGRANLENNVVLLLMGITLGVAVLVLIRLLPHPIISTGNINGSSSS